MNIISVNSVDGELVVDSRLIADRLDIQHDSLMHSLDTHKERIESRFGLIRFEIGKTNVRGRPQKYALLNESQATALMTFSRNTDAVVECKLDLVEAFQKAKAVLLQPKRPYFYDRLQDFQTKTGRIKSGWFCVFQEIIPLISDLERLGYNLPEDAVIDGSIGKRFCSYLRNECGIEPDDVCESYDHWYPGRRWPVKANLYPLELIQIFREWLEYRYYNQYLIPYFKGRKDPEALQAVSKFLGLLPST